MSNTGFKAYTNLEQYYVDSGVATGTTKTNSISDPDYVAPVWDPFYCPLPSITPSITTTPSVTPTITPTTTPSTTPTPTPTQTPVSATPTPTVTTNVTPTPTYTPTNTPTNTPTPTPTPTPTVGTTIEVTGFSAGLQPCIGGSCDDYLSYTVYLSTTTPVDVQYTLRVQVQYYGGPVYYQFFSGTIPAGYSYDYDNNNPCDGGGSYIGCGYTVLSACIDYIDATVTIDSGYQC
jgi:hypothetical protein